MPISGLTRLLAVNCAIDHIEENHYHLKLDPNQGPLNNLQLIERLAEALSTHLAQPSKISVTSGQADLPTPAQFQEHKRQAQLHDARSKLESDPGLQGILQHFDAIIADITLDSVDI